MFRSIFIYRAQESIRQIILDSRVPWRCPNGFSYSDDIRNADLLLKRLGPWVDDRQLLEKMVRWFSQRGPFATLPGDISTRIFSEFVQMITPLHVFRGKNGRAYKAHVPEMFFVVAMWREDLVDSEAHVRAIVANARRGVRAAEAARAAVEAARAALVPPRRRYFFVGRARVEFFDLDDLDGASEVVRSVVTDLSHLYCKLEALVILVYHMVAWIYSLFV